MDRYVAKKPAIAPAFAAFAFKPGGKSTKPAPPAPAPVPPRPRESDVIEDDSEEEGGDDDPPMVSPAPPSSLLKRQRTSEEGRGVKEGGGDRGALTVLDDDEDEDSGPLLVARGRGGGGGAGGGKRKGGKGRALVSDEDEDEEEHAEAKNDDDGFVAIRDSDDEDDFVAVVDDDEDGDNNISNNEQPQVFEEEGQEQGEEGQEEEEEEEDERAPDDVVAQCERVAADLRAALGLSAGADRVAATGEDSEEGEAGAAAAGGGGGGRASSLAGGAFVGGGSGDGAAAAAAASAGASSPSASGSAAPTSGIMSAAQIASAAGHADSGACLRLFQVVGVNFLLLLDSLGSSSTRKKGAGSAAGGSAAGAGGSAAGAGGEGGGGGCIVADEMGLGKTAQCCTFIAVRKARLTAIADEREREAEAAEEGEDEARRMRRQEKKEQKEKDDDGDDGDDDDDLFSSDDDDGNNNASASAAAAAAAAAAKRAAADEAIEASLRPALVVVPSSLVDNWSRELAVFAPRLRVLRFASSAERRQALREFSGRGSREAKRASIAASLREASVDVILTTYPLFESSGADAKEARTWLRRVEPFGVVALDEAHAVKGKTSARARRLGELGSSAAMRVFLTGTPLQNDLGELRTLLSFLLPGFDWEQLEGDEDGEGGNERGDAAAAANDDVCRRLRAALAPFCLRRLKSEVARQLPPKTRHEIRLALPEAQRASYDAALRAFAAKVKSSSSSSGSGSGGGGRSSDDGNANANGANDDAGDNSDNSDREQHQEALRLLRSMPAKALASSFTHLRKLANQPLLVRGGEFYDDAKVEELARASAALGIFGDGGALSTSKSNNDTSNDNNNNNNSNNTLLSRIREEISSYSDLELHHLAVAGGNRTRHLLLPPDAPLRNSAKSQELARLLPRLARDGHRVLIFSHWLGCLDVLGMLLDRLGLSWSRLDGSTPVAERMALVDEFNRGRGGGGKGGGDDAVVVENSNSDNDNDNGKISSPAKTVTTTNDTNISPPPPPFAMLLSTRAGGQGLNLCGADAVVFHDVGFNPSVERQGEDRAHRLGQTRPVSVFRLVSEGTVDEGIVELAERKAALGDAVMGEGGKEGEGGEAASSSSSSSSSEKEGMAQLLLQALEKIEKKK